MLYVEWCTAPTEGPAAEEAAPRCRHDPAHCVQPCTRTNWRTLCTHSGVVQGPGPSDGTRGARLGPCHCIHALRASVCVARHVMRCPRRQPGTLRHPAPLRNAKASRCASAPMCASGARQPGHAVRCNHALRKEPLVRHMACHATRGVVHVVQAGGARGLRHTAVGDRVRRRLGQLHFTR